MADTVAHTTDTAVLTGEAGEDTVAHTTADTGMVLGAGMAVMDMATTTVAKL